MSQTLVKQPGESRVYTMDFSANLIDGETVTSVIGVTGSPDGLTIGAASVTSDGKKAQFRVSSGVDGSSYKITVSVNTSLSNILESDGTLLVKQL